MQRLVTIQFGDRDMVFELARQGFVELVQNTQRGVTVDHLWHDDPESIDISNLGKTQVFTVHLFVDGVQRFFAPGNTHGDTGRCKSGLDFALNLLDQVTASAARFGDSFG